MPSGRLAAIDITAGVSTLIYSAPGGRAIKVTVSICNRGTKDALIRLALLDGDLDTLADEDYIEYDTILRVGGIIERSGLTMAQYQSFIGYSDADNVSFQIWG